MGLIIDTGSSVSILPSAVSNLGLRITQTKPHDVTGEVLDVKGQETATSLLNRCEFTHTFFDCSLPTQAVGLLVTDLLEK